MNITAISVEIAKLQLAPGDVLVVRGKGHIDGELAIRLRETLEAILPPGVKAMLIGDDVDLTVLTRVEIETRVAA